MKRRAQCFVAGGIRFVSESVPDPQYSFIGRILKRATRDVSRQLKKCFGLAHFLFCELVSGDRILGAPRHRRKTETPWISR